MLNPNPTLHKPQFFCTDGIQFFLSIAVSNTALEQKFNPRDFRKEGQIEDQFLKWG
jgi:hypothetical protein